MVKVNNKDTRTMPMALISSIFHKIINAYQVVIETEIKVDDHKK